MLVFFGCQESMENEDASITHTSKLTFYINKNVVNASSEEESKIINLWQDYLKSQEFQMRDGRHWNYEHSPIPDQFLWSIQQFIIADHNDKMQNTIVGVFPVDEEHYALKSMFSSVDDTTHEVTLRFLITVYAKKVNGFYKLINGTDFHKRIWRKMNVGHISYYTHPSHDFDHSRAEKMKQFNLYLADQYSMEPLHFDYFVANNTRDITTMMGFDFMPNKYKPDQTGGMAESYNYKILAGNNSEYYPHELVHLYNLNKFQKSTHPWVDEGIATFFGGSSGYQLSWHLKKLKSFLDDNPLFEIKELSKLETDIPNGEYLTSLKYAIGGLIAKNIFQKEGIQGIFDMLQCGKNDQDYFNLLEEKLNISQDSLENYIRSEVSKII